MPIECEILVAVTLYPTLAFRLRMSFTDNDAKV